MLLSSYEICLINLTITFISIYKHLSSNGIHYFVNGGGSMTDSISGSSSAELLWAGEGYSAFASVAATKTDLKIPMTLEQYSNEQNQQQTTAVQDLIIEENENYLKDIINNI